MNQMGSAGYQEVLGTWERHVEAVAQIDPGLAFDLQGDPPVWIEDARRKAAAKSDREVAFDDVDALLKTRQDKYFGCGASGDFADTLFREYTAIRDEVRKRR